MFKRVSKLYRSIEQENDLEKYKEISDQEYNNEQEIQLNETIMKCSLCKSQIYQLDQHLQTQTHMLKVEQFKKKYNRLVLKIRKSIYSKRRNRNLRKLHGYVLLYNLE